ncbi:MAG TPA: GIDE domain-containing protein [Gemmatimonadaceae bacterium]|nr:GIDE domain-containing protein [Gemmatimonadaceae bacterium]
MTPKSRGWGSIALIALLGAALAVWGLVRVRSSPGVRGLDDARTVAIREAAAAAGDSTPVRLQGVLVTVPPLVAPDGEEYALQTLVITHSSSTPGSAGRTTDYRRIAPAQIFLSDGDSAVAVDPTGLDLPPVPVLAEGRTQRDGVLPPDLAVHLVPGFTELPTRGGGDVTLRAIESGVPVVAYGTLVLQEGVPSLVRPANGDPYLISPLSFAEVRRMIASRDRTSRGLGWSMVVLGALVAIAALAYGARHA